MGLLCAGGGSMAAQALFATAQKRILPSSVADTGLSSLDMPTAESYWLQPAVLDSAIAHGCLPRSFSRSSSQSSSCLCQFCCYDKALRLPQASP